MVPRRKHPPEKGGLRCGKKAGGGRETNLRREFRRGGDLHLALLTERNQGGRRASDPGGLLPQQAQT